MTGLPPSRRALRISLIGGAVYDLALGCLILLGGTRLMAALGHPVTGYEFYLILGSLPLFLLPVLYVVAALNDSTDAFRAPVLWARGGGGVILILLTLVYRPEADWIFHAIGVVDLLWAGIHAVLWRSSGEESPAAGG